ncbi:ribonuclease P protein subunit p30 [Galendromus occidentalis]|uniref:Ribonuclease P protein subunit p30 n=1 Tax=Galendromus occidentalis TaxID=34638 RepID=A0AAJ6QYX9_9ACAR|nr:ribonuclease P protein subunit p30 [Galendromus occidentalis]
MGDLSVIVYENGGKLPEQTVLSCIRKAFKLGFSTIALNVIVGDTELNSKKALPKPILYDIPEQCVMEARSQNRRLRLLSRLSGKITDNQQAHKLQHDTVSSDYDIIAAYPTTDGLLNSVIVHGGVDIIYYPLLERCTWPKYSSISFATSKGILFELPYTTLMADQRITALKNMRRLTLRDKKGFIFSSNATSPDMIRGPLDVSFLGHMLDLNADLSRRLVWDGPEAVIVHAETRGRKERGSVMTLLARSAPEGERWLVEACLDVEPS